jgi:hypothetical protein
LQAFCNCVTQKTLTVERDEGQVLKTIFHVGQPKAGSTALQSTFLASQNALLEQSVLYPSNPNGFYNNHRLLFADLMTRETVPRHILKNYEHHELAAACQTLEASILQDVKNHNPACLVLSSESRFRTLPDEGRVTFRERLLSLGTDDIDIVAYIRSPAAWYLSALNQKMRHAWRTRQPNAPNISKTFKHFAEDFGSDHVKLRPFAREALTGGGIVEDFCAHFLSNYGVAPETLTAQGNANETFSAEAIDIVRRYRQYFMHDADDQMLPEGSALLAAVREGASDLNLSKPKLCGSLAELIDYSTTDVLWLRDTHGLVLPEYDYARVEAGRKTEMPQGKFRLDEIIQLDRTKQDELIAAIVQTSWVQSNPDRKAWFVGLPSDIRADARVADGRKSAVTPRQVVPSDPVISERQSRADRDAAVAIGRSIFRLDQTEKGSNIEARKNAWRATRRAYAKQGRAILKQLRKDGFELTKPDT